MKKTVFYGAFTALALCFIFSACSGVGLKAPSNTEANQSDNKYEIIGTISFSDSSRTAVTSLQMPAGVSLSANDFVFGIKKLNSSNSEKAGSVVAVIDPQTSTISYKATFKEPGWYIIACSLWNDAFYGKTQDFQVTATTTQAPVIRLRPYEYRSASSNNNLLGAVDLTINDQSGKLDSVTFKGDVYKPVHADTAAANNSFKEARTIKFSEGQARIQLSDVQPYSYEVTFCFNDSLGNTLYSTKEIVVVLPNFVTDTWLPATEFTITNQMIDDFGTEVVPSTQMAFYNYDYWPSDNKHYKLYFADNALTSLPDTADFGVQLSSSSNNDPTFCYDNDGKLYMYSSFFENGTQSLVATIDYPDGYYFTNLISTQTVNSISFDRATDNLYVFTYTGTNGFLYSCAKTELSNIVNSAKKYQIVTTDITDSDLKTRLQYCKKFTVHNDILFIPYLNVIDAPDGKSASLILTKADLSETVFNPTEGYYTVTLTDENLTTYNLFSNLYTGSVAPKITDIIYQDSDLYLLISDFSMTDSWYSDTAYRSRGAVVRINFFVNRIDVLGWTNETIDLSAAGVYFKNPSDKYCYSDAEHTQLFVLDGTQMLDTDHDELISSKYPSLYIPDGGNDLSLTAFYGPKKFIAIKPKKLVIADDGVAIYTNDDGALSYRNVNRVVIVDLEKFAIENASEVAVKYEGGASSDFTGDYTRDLHSTVNPCNFYYTTGSYSGDIYDSDGTQIVESGSLVDGQNLNYITLMIKRSDKQW